MRSSKLETAQDTVSAQFLADILEQTLAIMTQIQLLPSKMPDPVQKAHAEQRSEQAAEIATRLKKAAFHGDFLPFHGQVMRIFGFSDYLHDIHPTIKKTLPNITESLQDLRVKYQNHIYPLSGRDGYLDDTVIQYLNKTLRQANQN